MVMSRAPKRPHQFARACMPSLVVAMSMPLGGCLVRVGESGGATSAWSQQAAEKYDGPECSRVLYDLSELNGYDYNAKATTIDDAPEAQALLAVCRRGQKPGYAQHTVVQWPRVAALTYSDVLSKQDDAKLDLVLAATSTIFAVRGSDGIRDHLAEAPEARARRLGLARMWGEILSVNTLEEQLSRTKLPSEAASALVKDFQQAVAMARQERLSDVEQRLLVDIPVEVYRARAKHYADHADMYARLSALEASAATDQSDGVVEEIRALRRAFAARHANDDVLAMPLFARATAALATLHVLRNEPIDARAESQLYRHDGSYVAGFVQALRAAQNLELYRLDKSRTAYERAKKSGVDDATAEKLAAGNGERVSPRVLYDAKLSLPNFAIAIDERADSVRTESHRVAVVKQGPKLAKVSFEKLKIDTKIPYNCYRTNRIDRIEPSGKVRYESHCEWRDAVEIKESAKPLDFPAIEVAKIKPGDTLEFTRQGDAARVIRVTRQNELIQLRDAAW